MNTRNKSNNFVIDFDEASQAWRENKKALSNGMYKYICLKKTSNGDPCKRKPLLSCNLCSIHEKIKNNL